MAKITVLGSGGWGMALAISAFNNRNQVTLWSPFENEVKITVSGVPKARLKVTKK